MSWPQWDNAGAKRYANLLGPRTLKSIRNDNLQSKGLLSCLAATGIIKGKKIITSYEDTPEGDYEMGIDI